MYKGCNIDQETQKSSSAKIRALLFLTRWHKACRGDGESLVGIWQLPWAVKALYKAGSVGEQRTSMGDPVKDGGPHSLAKRCKLAARTRRIAFERFACMHPLSLHSDRGTKCFVRGSNLIIIEHHVKRWRQNWKQSTVLAAGPLVSCAKRSRLQTTSTALPVGYRHHSL
jgi:hypothetical protein